MEQDAAASVPSREQIGRLQQDVLEAVLSSGALPGASEPIYFPDLSFVLRGPEVLVLDENLLGPAPTEAQGLPVRVVSREELRGAATERGEVGYLRFHPADARAGEVRLTLEASLATPDPAARGAGLAGMQFILREDDGQWRGQAAGAVAF